MRIPLVDLHAQHVEVEDEVRAGWERVLAGTAFILGEDVAEFEREFAAFSGVRHCVGVANGTDALELAVRALGLDPDDEVLVPANTFIASAVAVVRAGARVRLVDVLPDSLLIDPDAVAAAMTRRTRVIMPVHLFGQVAPMRPLLDLAAKHGAVVLEDAAQAHGATQDGVGAGAFGAAAGTSFYPGKNLGAYGDGGAVLTGDDGVARRVRALRQYGGEEKYEHPTLGFNSRLDTLQAVVLRAKLRRLASWNDERRRAAARYDELLGDMPELTRTAVLPGNEPVWHLYVVQVPERDVVLRRLHEAGVGAGIHYPVPIHLHGAFAHLARSPGSFPVSEAAATRIVSLPLYPGMTEAQQQYVADVLRKALR